MAKLFKKFSLDLPFLSFWLDEAVFAF